MGKKCLAWSYKKKDVSSGRWRLMSYLLSPRVVLGNIDVRLWQCGPMANKPQYSSSKQGYQVVYCMAPRPNLINLNLPAFTTKKIHGLWLFTWKQLLWQNTDQDSEVRTNQIVWIYIWIFFSYSRNVLILMVVEAFFSRISALNHSLVSLLFSEDEFECSSRQR